MKKFWLLLVSIYFICTSASGQNEDAGCRRIFNKLRGGFLDVLDDIKLSGEIKNNDITSLSEWILELKEHVTRNSFGLFSGSGQTGCHADIADIFRNFLGSNYQFIFNPKILTNIANCPDQNRSKRIAFALRTIFNNANATTLKTTEKDLYTAFYDHLYEMPAPDEIKVVEFFYRHMNDVRKATGFEPEPTGHDKNVYALEFIRSFRTPLKFYFGSAEEEYVKTDAANSITDIRTMSFGPIGAYRREIFNEWYESFLLIDLELEKLQETCSQISIDPTSGLTKRITTYTPIQTPSKPPVKPTGNNGQLKPGHGWALISILDANGKLYREYGDFPTINLSQIVDNRKLIIHTIRSSEYHQVTAGNYYATISMAAHPQKGITIESGGEKKVVLQLGRLVLDPRNHDGSPGQHDITIKAIVDKDENTDRAILTINVVSNSSEGGDSINLAPGRYEVCTNYGVIQKDIINIESNKTTKLTITGAAKFTAPKEQIRISRVIPNGVRVYVAMLANGRDIQLPPGEYQIDGPGTSLTYRQKMESGGSYTYKRP